MDGNTEKAISYHKILKIWGHELYFCILSWYVTQYSVENDANSWVTREIFYFNRAHLFGLNTSKDRIISYAFYIDLGGQIA